MSTGFSGSLTISRSLLGDNSPGSANAITEQLIGKGSIAQSTATTIGTITVPNGTHSATGLLVVRSGISASGHQYDSTRVAIYAFAVTRITDTAAAAALATVTNAAIATIGGGQTLTTALSLSAVLTDATGVNTFDIQATNTVSSSGISETSCIVLINNAMAGGVTISSAS